MQSKAHVHRVAATDLTASYVYSTSVPISGCSYHSVLAVLDPDADDEVLNIDVQISPDDINTSDASSEWISVGTVVNTAGSIAFTASTFKVAAAAAGTKVRGHFSIENVNAYKMRVGVKSTFTGGGSATGNAQVVVFSRGC